VVDSLRSNRNISQLDEEEKNEILNNNLNFSQECYEQEMMRMADADTLARMIGMLPQMQQEIVHLRFYEELSFKEIAQITNVSINTALGRMRYATLNLRKMMIDNALELAV
jgi:RNA polymerase sigma-70 factor (ECF subfamily)